MTNSVFGNLVPLLYLAEKFGELKTLQDRAIAAQWVLFANATLGPGLFVEANRAKEAPRLLGSLNTLLSQRDYLVGDRLGVADIAVGPIWPMSRCSSRTLTSALSRCTELYQSSDAATGLSKHDRSALGATQQFVALDPKKIPDWLSHDDSSLCCC